MMQRKQRSADRLVDIEAEIVYQTEKALLLDDGSRKEWVPKAAVEDNGDGTFTMPERLAAEKGFV